MKRILFIPAIFFCICCGSMRKTVNKSAVEVKQTERFHKDSVGVQLTDSIAVQRNSHAWNSKADSSYERVVEEEIIEFTVAAKDSLVQQPDWARHNKDHLAAGTKIIHTTRKIRERGAKKNEVNKQTAWQDSTSKKTGEQAIITVLQETDSTGKTSQAVKTTSRSGIRWYVWMIACLVLGGVIWWKGRGMITRLSKTLNYLL